MYKHFALLNWTVLFLLCMLKYWTIISVTDLETGVCLHDELWPPAIINNTHIQICWQEPLRKLDQPSANGIITTIKWELMAFRRQEKFRNQSKLHKKSRGHFIHQAKFIF